MSDYLVRAVSDSGSIRAFAIVSTDTVNTAFKYHKTSPVVTAALGRLLTAAAIMGADLKGEKDTVTLQITGGGPAGRVLATSDSKCNVKGYASYPVVDLPLNSQGKLDVAGAVGTNGYLTVITDMGLKEPYIGKVELVSGEIGDDITNYYAVSQQTPSAVGLGVLVDVDYSVKCAGGFTVQVMPDATEEDISKLEENVGKLKSVTAMLEEGKTPEDILSFVLEGIAYHNTDTSPVNYFCNCSRERVERALITLGDDEINDMIQKDGGAELTCHFCDKVYKFSENDLKELIQND